MQEALRAILLIGDLWHIHGYGFQFLWLTHFYHVATGKTSSLCLVQPVLSRVIAPITVVNIWGTFCGPCIGEMPELAEWSEAMPSNVQIIGLVCDIEGEDDQEHKDKAKEIMEKVGADFINLIPGEGLDSLLSEVTGVPTTIFIDKNGNITGKEVIGANVAAYKEFVEDYINAE